MGSAAELFMRFGKEAVKKEGKVRGGEGARPGSAAMGVGEWELGCVTNRGL